VFPILFASGCADDDSQPGRGAMIDTTLKKNFFFILKKLK
jgi:hypothetical protein